jgi:hypothetical protein
MMILGLQDLELAFVEIEIPHLLNIFEAPLLLDQLLRRGVLEPFLRRRAIVE